LMVQPEEQISNNDLIENSNKVSNEHDKDIYEKIKRLNDTIISIYNELINSGADKEIIMRRLGPFKRDLKKIENSIHESQINDGTTMEYFSQTKDLLESLINQ
ncbi:MAG: MarR family transcriptional regulator, partial [Methanomethylovorans sp.]|nr:MarR family transcriptional regulator [Methanomethylovorans sp.]